MEERNVHLCGSMIFYCRNIKTCLTTSISTIQFIYCILLNESGKWKFVLLMLFSMMFQYSLPFYVPNSLPLVKTHTETIFWNKYSKTLYILNGRGKKKDSFALSAGEKGMRLNGISAECRHPLTSANN